MSRGAPANLKKFLANSNVRVVRDDTRPRMDSPPRPVRRRAVSVSPARPTKKTARIRSAEKASPVRKISSPNPKSTSLVFSRLEYKLFNAVSKPVTPTTVNVRKINIPQNSTRLVKTSDGPEFFFRIKKVQTCDSKFRCVPGATHVAKMTCEAMYKPSDKKKVDVYVFKNGTIRLTGSLLGTSAKFIKDLRDHILKYYVKTTPHRRVEINNLNAQFRINGVLRPDTTKKALLQKRISYSYEPEIKQNFIKLSYGGHSFQIWFSGLVQLFGYKSSVSIQRAYTVGKSLMQALDGVGAVSVKGQYTPTARSSSKAKATVAVAPRSKNLQNMTKQELIAHAKKAGVTLPKHIVKANIIKLIQSKGNSVANDLKGMFGANWLRRYELYTVIDFPRDVEKVKNLLTRAPVNKHRSVMRAYVAKVKRDRKGTYESLLKTLNNVFNKR
jgi:TATA-box binding protein (TBP) (component of TFIID and TFIIIB)